MRAKVIENMVAKIEAEKKEREEAKERKKKARAHGGRYAYVSNSFFSNAFKEDTRSDNFNLIQTKFIGTGRFCTACVWDAYEGQLATGNFAQQNQLWQGLQLISNKEQ